MTRFAIERFRITLTALALVLVAGALSYLNLPRDEDPGFIIRQAMVVTYWPGASPERVELLVTDKLEKAIQELPELDWVRSQSATGVSAITASIKPSYTELQPIWDRMRRKVERVEHDLPEGVIGPFVNDEFGDVFGVVVALTGEGFSYRELKAFADEVRDELLLFAGEAAKVELHGVQDERIFVEYNNARLGELGIPPGYLLQTLAAQNIVIPGGAVLIGSERMALEPTGAFDTVEDLRRTVLNAPGGTELFYLEDIAEVRRGYVDPPTRVATVSGERALILAVSMREGGNVLRLGEQVRDVLRRLEAHYPIGVEFEIIQFQPDEVAAKVNDFMRNLIQAVALVALVMLVFLGPRAGLIVATLAPAAMMACFVVMPFAGVQLDQVSLAALIVVLGMLVDNGIVMAESISTQAEQGKPVRQAAMDSARELRLPLLTASLITSAAFLPIFLAESEAGEYTAALFKVVFITLMASWILSLTMIPLFCTLFLDPRRRKLRAGDGAAPGPLYESRFYRAYRALLLAMLRRRRSVAVLVAAAFLLALFGFRFVPDMFFPPSDRAVFTIELRLPVGAAIEETMAITAGVERMLEEEYAAREGAGGVTNWAAFAGAGAPRFILTYAPQPPSSEYAILLVNTTSRAVIDDIAPRIERDIVARYPDARVLARPLELGPPVGKPIAVRVSGRDAERLFENVAAVKDLLRDLPGVRNIDDNWGPQSRKLRVNIDQPRARRAGVTSQDIALSLQTFFSGLPVTEYREGGGIIPVVLRASGADRHDIGKIESVNVHALATGHSVPLKQVADIELTWQPAKILRRNRLKTVTVEADLASGVTTAEVIRQIRPALDAAQAEWGPGYLYDFGGEYEEAEIAQRSILVKLPIAGMIVVLLLVGLFNSFRRPLIILLTIPLGFIGVVVGLLAVPNMYFGFLTLLGIISLSGIVINNAIVLIDRIRIETDDKGLDPHQAVVSAAQQRLRPVLLTSCTTIFGMLPLYLGGGPLFEPLAVVIIFGLLFAAVLTLGVAPVLYALFFGLHFRHFQWRGAAGATDKFPAHCQATITRKNG